MTTVTWFLVMALSLVVVLALVAIVLLTDFETDAMDNELTRVEVEVRRAERRLHDIASQSFEAMLAETRSNDGRW